VGKEYDVIIQEKLDAIKAAIQNAFPEYQVDYRGCWDRIYKFEVIREGIYPCRLDFVWEYLLNTNQKKILNRLNNIFKTISNASKPIKILFTENSVNVEDW
jgi:hypothetical protein